MDLTFDSLAAHVGEHFEFATNAEPVQLTLASAEPADGGGSLVFTGPRSPQLAQGSYPVNHAELGGVLFIVPVGMTGDLASYQAIFA